MNKVLEENPIQKIQIQKIQAEKDLDFIIELACNVKYHFKDVKHPQSIYFLARLSLIEKEARECKGLLGEVLEIEPNISIQS